jgi:hypothetical protein
VWWHVSCYPSYVGIINGRTEVQAGPGANLRSYLKTTKAKRAGSVVYRVEPFLNRYGALSSISSTTNRKIKKFFLLKYDIYNTFLTLWACSL